jgi:hypothetical protein
LQSTSLWQSFELGHRPFEGAVIICDAAYQCLDWLIPPFAGQQVVRISQVNLKMFGYNVNSPPQIQIQIHLSLHKYRMHTNAKIDSVIIPKTVMIKLIQYLFPNVLKLQE